MTSGSNMETHNSKWWSRMIEKHGSEEAVRQFMSESAQKSSKNAAGTGGFAYMAKHDPERLREVSRVGGSRKKS